MNVKPNHIKGAIKMTKEKSTVNVDGTVGIVNNLPWRAEPTEKELIKCTPTEVFYDILKFYKMHMKYQKPIEYLIDTLWDMHTYFMYRCDSTPYLQFTGAGNEKGKSRALKVHYRLAYRATLVTSGTDPAFRKCFTEGASIMVDQAENLFYDGKRKTFMYQAFTSGYTTDFKHIQLDQKGTKEFDCKEVFGAKMFCQQEDGKTDNPIDQRCFEHRMVQGIPEVRSMRRNPESYKMMDSIFRKMHYLRIQDLKTYDIFKTASYEMLTSNAVTTTQLNECESSIKLNYETGLDGRVGELVDPLILMCRLLHLPDWIEEQLYIFAFELSDIKRDRSRDTLPAHVYIGIKGVIESQKSAISPDIFITSTIVRSWLLSNFNNIYTEKNLYLNNISKIMKGMGLEQEKQQVNGQRPYNMAKTENIDIMDKVKKQYDNSNSIEERCLIYESEHNISTDLTKTVYERWQLYQKYKDMFEMARKLHTEAVESQVGSEEELNKEYQHWLESCPPNEEEERYAEYLEKQQ